MNAIHEKVRARIAPSEKMASELLYLFIGLLAT